MSSTPHIYLAIETYDPRLHRATFRVKRKSLVKPFGDFACALRALSALKGQGVSLMGRKRPVGTVLSVEKAKPDGGLLLVVQITAEPTQKLICSDVIKGARVRLYDFGGTDQTPSLGNLILADRPEEQDLILRKGGANLSAAERLQGIALQIQDLEDYNVALRRSPACPHRRLAAMRQSLLRSTDQLGHVTGLLEQVERLAKTPLPPKCGGVFAS